MAMKGILTDTEFDLHVNAIRNGTGLITGGLVIGDNTDQCAAIALSMQQCELKEDPLLGAGLTHFVRCKYNRSQVEERMRQHLTRAGIDYRDYRHRIGLTIITNGL